MFGLGLIFNAVKTIGNVMQQRQETKRFNAMAERNHAYRMAPQLYQWLLIGIFGAIYGLKPAAGMFGKK